MGSKHLTTRNRTIAGLDTIYYLHKGPHQMHIQLRHSALLETVKKKNYLSSQETIKNAYITKISVSLPNRG